VYYDALLAKVVAHSFERGAAIARLAAALRATRIEGVTTNVPLLLAILDDAAFRSGDFGTGLIAERGLIDAAGAGTRAAVLRQAAYLLQTGRAWRSAGVGVPLPLEADGHVFRMTATRGGDVWTIAGDLEAAIDARQPAAPEPRVRFAPPPRIEGTGSLAGAATGTISAPMPGKIIEVAVGAGDAVAAHALLLVLEAMKMEHRIEAPLAGTVREVLVQPGAVVKGGAPLVRID
jgi:acetyl/propionyl-CoA carboxylase alpha subunit